MHQTKKANQWHHGMKAHIGVDSTYAGQKGVLKEMSPRAKDFTNKRGYRNQPLSQRDKEINRAKSQTRAKVEHPFLTLKRIWGFAKVRPQSAKGRTKR